jgi:hypothetical protein
VSRGGNHSVPSISLLSGQRNSRRPEKLSRRLLAYYMMRNREARRPTKAALAGLRSSSIRSAGCRHGYDCTAHIEHLSLPEPPRGVFLRPSVTMLRTFFSSRCGVVAFQSNSGAWPALNQKAKSQSLVRKSPGRWFWHLQFCPHGGFPSPSPPAGKANAQIRPEGQHRVARCLAPSLPHPRQKILALVGNPTQGQRVQGYADLAFSRRKWNFRK